MRQSGVECVNLGLNASIWGWMRQSGVECVNLGLNA